MEERYYTLKNILAKNCVYNVIIGERSNGKTCAVLSYFVDEYFEHERQFAVVRRWDTDIQPKLMNTLFAPQFLIDKIRKYTDNLYNGISYRAGVFYLTYKDEKDGKTKLDKDKIVGYGFSLNGSEHYKSTSYPHVTNILFDEFLTRGTYLPDEFVVFMNVVSTIVRDRDNVKIFMCGNTVNQYSPYINEMGLNHIKNMKKGTIDIYTYDDCPDLSVAVEFSDFPAQKKGSEKYFAFNNQKLKMITQGAWELPVAPHLPHKYNWLTDVLFRYYIEFDGELLLCEIIGIENMMFTYIHRWTKEIDRDKELIYSPEYDARPNWRRKMTQPLDDLDRKINMHWVQDKVYYQDNTVAEVVRNYLGFCTSDKTLT